MSSMSLRSMRTLARSLGSASRGTPSRSLSTTSSLRQGGAPSAATSPNSAPAPPPPATAGAAAPGSSAASAAAPADPKLSGIVDQIERLTLLEAAELVSQLKTRLNIQDIAMPVASAGPAAPAAAASGAAPAEEEKPKEKTIFTVVLKGLKDASAKAKVIKEVKALNSTMNLVEAKKFVESAPQTLKEGLTKEDAEKLQKAVEAAGGQVELE